MRSLIFLSLLLSLPHAAEGQPREVSSPDSAVLAQLRASVVPGQAVHLRLTDRLAPLAVRLVSLDRDSLQFRHDVRGAPVQSVVLRRLERLEIYDTESRQGGLRVVIGATLGGGLGALVGTFAVLPSVALDGGNSVDLDLVLGAAIVSGAILGGILGRSAEQRSAPWRTVYVAEPER